VVLVVISGRLLAGEPLDARPAVRLADKFGRPAARPGVIGYAAYGVAFALSSLGCSLPLFLAVVGTALARGGLAAGAGQMVVYALGMGTVVSVLTIAVALLGQVAISRVRGAVGLLRPISALLLLVTGGYIVYYWLSAGGILG
jgi:cytochrome c biogenesis protein CcdA